VGGPGALYQKKTQVYKKNLFGRIRRGGLLGSLLKKTFKKTITKIPFLRG
jgi:hypothetical protein